MNFTGYIFAIIELALLIEHCHATTIYQDLVGYIFKDYDTGVRPVVDPTTTVDVKLRFGVIQLLDVEEVSQTVQLVSFMELRWNDEILRWNSSEFGNISRFRYPHDKVWKPDVILTNTPDLNDGPVVSRASTNVIINSNGDIVDGFIAVFKATCRNLDMTYFPFDEHNCFLEFCSWSYSGNEMDIFEGGYAYDLPNSMKQVPSTEWDVTVVQIEKIVEWECCPNETYPLLRLHLQLKRRPLYYMINLVVPTVITCYVSFFGMFSPSSNQGERLEKAFLGITTLLAVSLLMLTVSQNMPVTSVAIPLMGWFLGIYIIIIAVAIISTSIIMHIDTEGLKGRPLSKWTKKWIVRRLGRCLLVTMPEEMHSTLLIEETPSKFRRKNSDKLFINGTNNELAKFCQDKLNHIDAILTSLHQAHVKSEHMEAIKREWNQLCLVLDRFCLYFYIILSTAFTLGLLHR